MNANKYIRTIKITALWDTIDLCWNLNPDVNVLSGGNGSGKSILLRSIADMFRIGTIAPQRRELIGRIEITFGDGEKISSEEAFDHHRYKIAVISTFDTRIPESETLRKASTVNLHTDLDLEIFQLTNSYLKYQLEIGREIINALTMGKSSEEVAMLADHKNTFYDIVDSLFESTNKKIDRNQDTLSFTMGRKKISPYQLSSGEKQALIILTNTLIQNRRPYIMILDEPEISLHFDWQKRLIEDIMTLNPSLQLICSTHSPAMVMNGWLDRVSEISELVIHRDR